MMTQGEVLVLCGWIIGGYLINLCLLHWCLERRAKKAAPEHSGRPTSEGGQ